MNQNVKQPDNTLLQSFRAFRSGETPAYGQVGGEGLVARFKTLVLPHEYHRATIKTIHHQVLNVAGKIVRTA